MAVTEQTAPPPPPPGVWCPAVTFFDRTTDELDLVSQKQYFHYLSTTGLRGLVILGTNAEAFLLTREERRALIAAAREACGPAFPIIAGTGAHSTKQALEYIADAKSAGADYALVLPPAYFGKATSPAVLERFFDDVATKSALPIVIYNFPGVCNGIDLDSDFIAKMAERHPNIVGCKLTCGSVAKITRLAAVLPPSKFSVFGGQSDFLIGGLSVGSAGCIAAFANVFPKTLARVYKLYKAGQYDEALALHQKAALAEVPTKAGAAATKYAVSLFSARDAGIADATDKLQPRTPYEPAPAAARAQIEARMAELAKIERSL